MLQLASTHFLPVLSAYTFSIPVKTQSNSIRLGQLLANKAICLDTELCLLRHMLLAGLIF